MKKKYVVVCQKWEESERGWGTRPDGYSLHLSEEDRVAFVDAYWKRMPTEVPDEYSKECGTPYWCEVNEETYVKVLGGNHGAWFLGNDYPDGDTDGWMHCSDGGVGKVRTFKY